ncbi:MAG: TIR domain-containing protein [Chloroflexota bacterium]|nr:TIR domain-containing protein [Chloroflexota bacterium]
MKEYSVYIGGFQRFTRERLAKSGVFVAHDFFGDDDVKREDYRNRFNIAFRDTPYMPVFAPIDSGTILETLSQSMVNCHAGVFDVTTNRRLNANVLIELGVCLAINHPAVVIAEGTDPLPDFLETLKPLRYTGRRDLIAQLSKELDDRIAESQRLQHGYCVVCRRADCGCRTSIPTEDKTYMLLGTHVIDDEVDLDVEEALLHFDLKRLQIDGVSALDLCEWLRLIKRVRFAFLYSKALGNAHHGDENAATMLQLGLAVGSPTPWRIIVPVDEFPPTDVSAFMAVIRNPNARIFQDRLSGAASKLLEEFNPLHVVNPGGLNRLILDEWIDDEAVQSREVDDIYPSATTILVVNDKDEDRDRLSRLLLAQDWEVVEAKTNEEAFQVLTTREIGLVITDIEREARRYGERGNLGLELIKAIQDRFPTMVYTAYDETSARKLLDGLRPVALLNQAANDDFIVGKVRSQIVHSHPAELLSAEVPNTGFVFLSYSSRDAHEFVDRLENDLNREGIATWNDRQQLRPSEPWQQQVEKAIRECSVVAIVIAPSSRESQSLNVDLKLIAELKKPIVPILIGEYEDVPQEILHLVYADMGRDNYATQLPRVVESLRWYLSGNTLQSFPDEDFVYVSYTPADIAVSRQLQADLERNAVRHWSEDYILLGQDWRQVIDRAQQACKVGLVVVSDNSRNSASGSKGVQENIRGFIQHSKPIIPAVIDDFKNMPQSLKHIQAADLRNYQEGLPNLLDSLRQLLTGKETIQEDQTRRDERIFVVYVRKDTSSILDRLLNYVEDAGFNVFRDLSDIPVGADFATVIRNEVERSDIILALFSENALQSQWWVRETTWAMQLDKLIIPILLDNVQMPKSNSLPNELRNFSDLEAIRIRTEEIDRDIQELLSLLYQNSAFSMSELIALASLVENKTNAPNANEGESNDVGETSSNFVEHRSGAKKTDTVESKSDFDEPGV